MEYQWYLWICFFFFYSFIGWIWECLYVSVRKKQWVNRGFLNGPVLPIYGSGAVVILYLTLPFQGNLIAIFIAGMVGATMLEFCTGYFMEMIFKMKYWDYTGCIGNVKGYICLKASLCWGTFSVLLTTWVHPYIEEFMFKIPVRMLSITVLIVSILFVIDFIVSAREAIDLRRIIIARTAMNEEIQRLQKRMDVMIAVTTDGFEQIADRIVEEKQAMVDQMTERAMEEKKAAAEEIANIKTQLEAYYAKFEEAGTKAHKHALHVLRRNPSSKLQEQTQFTIAQMKGYLEEKVSKMKK